MPKVKQINRKTLGEIRPEIDKALATVGKKLGLLLNMGRITFDPEAGTFTSKIEASLESNATGIGNTNLSAPLPAHLIKHKTYLEQNYQWLGIKKNRIGAWFRNPNGKYQLIGYNPRAKKFPYVIIDESNKDYKAGKSFVEASTWL